MSRQSRERRRGAPPEPEERTEVTNQALIDLQAHFNHTGHPEVAYRIAEGVHLFDLDDAKQAKLASNLEGLSPKEALAGLSLDEDEQDDTESLDEDAEITEGNGDTSEATPDGEEEGDEEPVKLDELSRDELVTLANDQYDLGLPGNIAKQDAIDAILAQQE